MQLSWTSVRRLPDPQREIVFVSYGDRQPIVALRAESPVSKPPAVPIDTVKVDHSFIRGGPGAGIANPQTSKNRRSFEQAS